MAGEHEDVWAAGKLYEPYVGRWSRLVAREFLAWLGVPPQKDWLDVGCGTGALSETLLEYTDPHAVTGVDPSSGFLEYAKAHLTDPRAAFALGDAQSLPFDAESFDVAVSGLVLNFVPQPAQAVAEMARVVRSGGTLAAYVWDYAEKMELIRRFWDVAVALEPAASNLDEARRFPLCQPDALADLFTSAGLGQVEGCPIEVPTRFRDFADFWSPFLGGQGPAPAYAMSLGEEHRVAIRERLKASLPTSRDGSISLVARVWAVRGTVVD